ncbi:MAG: tetratricopeptide repeat protein [Candidatus Omnitrophota bacterium]
MRKKTVRYSLIALFVLLAFSKMSYSDKLMEEQAIKYFKEAVEAQKKGDFDYAISLYTKAIYAKEKYVKAYNNLGTAYAQKGERVKAEELYNLAIEIDPYYSVALKNLAIIFAERGDYDTFFEYWKKAAGLDIFSPFIIDEEKD